MNELNNNLIEVKDFLKKRTFFQSDDSSEELNNTIMEMDKILFEEGIHPDLQRLPSTRGDVYFSLVKLYENDFKSLKAFVINREKGERLSESFQKIYEGKKMRNPTLQRGILELKRAEERDIEPFSLDYYAKSALSAFIYSFSAEEKMALIPKDAEDQKICMRNMSYYLGYEESIARPIFGYMNANHELMDKVAAYFLDNKYSVVEVFAGNGLFSRMLKDRGVDIIATEKYSPEENKYATVRNQSTFSDIILMDAKNAAKEYSNRDIILMSWAPDKNRIASDTLLEFKKHNPKGKAFVLTEPYGGCTMDDRSFKISKEIFDEKIVDINKSHNSFRGIADTFQLWDINPFYEEEWHCY